VGEGNCWVVCGGERKWGLHSRAGGGVGNDTACTNNKPVATWYNNVKDCDAQEKREGGSHAGYGGRRNRCTRKLSDSDPEETKVKKTGKEKKDRGKGVAPMGGRVPISVRVT